MVLKGNSVANRRSRMLWTIALLLMALLVSSSNTPALASQVGLAAAKPNSVRIVSVTTSPANFVYNNTYWNILRVFVTFDDPLKELYLPILTAVRPGTDDFGRIINNRDCNDLGTYGPCWVDSAIQQTVCDPTCHTVGDPYRPIKVDGSLSTFAYDLVLEGRPVFGTYILKVSTQLKDVWSVFGWDGYGPSSTSSVKFWTRSAISAASTASTVVKGSKFAIRGRLLAQHSDGSKFGYPARAVDIIFDPTGDARSYRIATTTTDSKGYFRKTIVAARSGTWTAAFKGYSTVWKSTSAARAVKVTTNVKLGLSMAPRPAASGSTVKGKGVLTRYSASKGWVGVRSVVVYFYFTDKATSRRVYAGSARTTTGGRFQKSFKVTTSGIWSAKVLASGNYVERQSAGVKVGTF